MENSPGEMGCLAPAPGISRGWKGHAWEQLILPRKLTGQLLWSPSNSGPMSYARQVVTIHDVVSLDHPEWFNRAYVKWYNYLLPKLCKRAAHIITISEFSRQRILETLSVPEAKISLIYNGTDDLVRGPVTGPSRFPVPFERYILSLGSLEPRKNIPLLLEAWSKSLQEIPEDVGLVIVGGKGNERIFKDSAISEFTERVHFTGHVSDMSIGQLYAESLCFVYLSTYEGFGLPPLEAMSKGTPVITGNLTSLPEVVGHAGLLVDPYSVTDCAAALVKLINDEKLRSTLSDRSVVQSQKFNWGEAALKTWDVLTRF